MIEPYIACRRVKFIYPDGKECDGEIAIGLPVQEATQASCLAVLDGLSTPPGQLHGADPLQALAAALQHLADELHAFVTQGGRVRHPEGEDVDLEATFGRLWPR